MSSSAKWIRATIVFVVLSLTVAQMEPAAFGQNVDDKLNTERSLADIVRQKTYRDVPSYTRTAVAQTTPQRPPSAVAVRMNSLPTAPAAPPPKAKAGKLVLIVAAVGAAIAAATLAGGKQPSPAVGSIAAPLPTVVVLQPTVGQPQ